MEWDEFQQQSRTGYNIIVIKGTVHDVLAFVTEHPGGTAIITGAKLKDATEMLEKGYMVEAGLGEKYPSAEFCPTVSRAVFWIGPLTSPPSHGVSRGYHQIRYKNAAGSNCSSEGSGSSG
ncbi:hypothetical protein N7495_009706 [Penicillium taxi]|uniref:uncharacterized protein n=1 Tax=Penicillium taxi TaxID=168475 RepID=UPI002544FC0E|nr:uncharacterized protein N7495_009706 [Penicillium taxi]KAJ5885196.1 hypothetical protein N7495_009706 [Penicillium taxi]